MLGYKDEDILLLHYDIKVAQLNTSYELLIVLISDELKKINCLVFIEDFTSFLF